VRLDLPLVNIELAALCAGPGRTVGLVNRRGNTADMENAREGEAAEARTDDRDWGQYRGPFRCSGTPFQNLLLERCSINVNTALMTTKTQRPERRMRALSKERIVEAAIEILDADGESALTFRALAARLATGSGAIYWHVADKQELFAAAADHVIARVASEAGRAAKPREAIRILALGVFDAIDAHPWVGGQLSRDPWQYAVLRILEGVGGQVQALGVPECMQFNAATAILSFILGLAGQYAAGARLFARDTDRTAFLGAVAAQWAKLDPVEHPFVRRVAARLPGHDDREQFLAGIDLILAGIDTVR
jgi:AcrR family transcriptional regulator